MQLSELPRQILTFFGERRLKAGACTTLPELDSLFGSDPSVAAAVSELVSEGYFIAPDANTVELTARGSRAALRLARQAA